MQTLLAVFAGLLASCLFALAQTNLSLTNDVPIGEYGMRLVFCDNFFERPNSLPLTDVSDLHAEKELTWLLHNPTTNKVSVIYIGETNSFDFKVFNTNRTEIRKTARGVAMTAGPKSLTTLRGNPYGSRIGGGAAPGGYAPFTFSARLTDLFEFPTDGIYLLEVRYWAWSSTKQRFILSEPVRLRVIKGEDRSARQGTRGRL
jgi:hypothetical protein